MTRATPVPFSRPTAGRFALCLAALALLAGCQGVPRGDAGGRTNPYNTQPGDLASNRASVPDLLQLSDQTAEALAMELSEIPEIRDAPQKVVLELGDILNQTHTPTADFELIQNRLRSNLRKSRLLRDHVMFVESGARMDRELQRIQGSSRDRDLLQEGRGGGGTARYDPSQTYVLQGDFQEADRPGIRRYFFNFKLVNLATREILFDHPFDSAMRGY